MSRACKLKIEINLFHIQKLSQVGLYIGVRRFAVIPLLIVNLIMTFWKLNVEESMWLLNFSFCVVLLGFS